MLVSGVKKTCVNEILHYVENKHGFEDAQQKRYTLREKKHSTKHCKMTNNLVQPRNKRIQDLKVDNKDKERRKNLASASPFITRINLFSRTTNDISSSCENFVFLLCASQTLIIYFYIEYAKRNLNVGRQGD